MVEATSSSCSSESPGDGMSCSRECAKIVQRIRKARGITSLLQKVIVSKQQRNDELKLKASHGAASFAISQKNMSEYWLQGMAAKHQRTLQKYHGRRTAETAPRWKLLLSSRYDLQILTHLFIILTYLYIIYIYTVYDNMMLREAKQHTHTHAH